MILRVKVINGKKINVGDIEGMEIYSANALSDFLDEDYTIEGHVQGNIQGYKAEDDDQREDIGYVAAYCERPTHFFILERANMKRCDKYIKKAERKQSVKSWIETYGQGTVATASIITAISTLIIAVVSIKKC